MSMVCGLDLHRQQITFDALETASGEVWRGRVWQPDRARFRRWLAGNAGTRPVPRRGPNRGQEARGRQAAAAGAPARRAPVGCLLVTTPVILPPRDDVVARARTWW